MSLDNKAILVTGGTGTFGKKFIETVFHKYNPSKVVIYSRDEFKQDVVKKMFERLLSEENAKKLRYFIGDVRDKERMYRAFRDIDYVVHAAAMKRVETCEFNPFEAIKTNINGAQNIIDAALDRGIQKVVALSTDKAVNPTTLYGGTKLVSDKLFISANAYSGKNGTTFSVVRYGNVAGSRGSVIPIFKELIENGATELPITDTRMTRFWITIEEAIELVFKALDESKGGETYISKIPSFNVVDLAEAMLPGCSMRTIGIREIEKLHEIMITQDDSRLTYEYDKHYIIYQNVGLETKDKIWPGGIKVKDGFEYSSNCNREWLSIEEIRKRIKEF